MKSLLLKMAEIKKEPKSFKKLTTNTTLLKKVTDINFINKMQKTFLTNNMAKMQKVILINQISNTTLENTTKSSKPADASA